MRIAIFGASGRTGRQLVEQAVAQGHQVTAIVRSPDGLASDLRGAVRLVKADVMDPDAIARALVDADTAVSALSGPGRAPSSVWSESMRSIVQAMREASVRRFIAITGSMLDATGDGPFFRYIGKPIARRMLKGSANDMRRAEELIHESGLEWTIIRAPRLTDKPARGYRIALERNVPPRVQPLPRRPRRLRARGPGRRRNDPAARIRGAVTVRR
jgi:putative NADH-flavin reductase